MGSNGEKPEGLYQWELVAVCPSNGPQALPTMLDNAPEEPMAFIDTFHAESIFSHHHANKNTIGHSDPRWNDRVDHCSDLWENRRRNDRSEMHGSILRAV
ncbi:hypothetical protein G5I_02613 [Acromyrmex echinatior]|uniref:Uncharacterized protein n=1 Tax=Acromyrmex echinatior TaxID=103372 RepID=F4WAS1_ACREC|nr:hypothetical protein G5I_02613 [Acromyrmex echinatior]